MKTKPKQNTPKLAVLNITIPVRVTLRSMKLTQPSDVCSDEGQEIHLIADDAGDGPFLVVSTNRWAIDSDEVGIFCDLLKGFLSAAEQAQVVADSDPTLADAAD